MGVYEDLYLSIYLSTYLSIYLSVHPHTYIYTCTHTHTYVLQAFVGSWPLFSLLILYTVGRTPWMVDKPVTRPLPMHRSTHTSMPRVEFEHTIPVFERAKTVHALD
jgi:hypothetical protein